MEKTIYLLSCVKDGGIYRCILSPEGKLRIVDKATLDRPMYAVIRENRLYVILRAPFPDSKESGIIIFDIRDGKLTNPSKLLSTKGQVACHLCVEDDGIYVANYTSGSVIKMPDTLVAHQGRSVNENRQSSAHAHYINATPDGKYICAVDLGMDKILVYDKDLHPVSTVAAKPGNGPRHLAFSDDGKYAYCANELSSTVTVLSYCDGKLEVLREYSTLPDGFAEENTTAAIRYQEGYVYISNRGHDSIACFLAEGEKLTLTDIVSCAGASPRDFHILGEFLICANEASDNVAVFKIQGGTLQQVDQLPLPAPLCVCF